MQTVPAGDWLSDGWTPPSTTNGVTVARNDASSSTLYIGDKLWVEPSQWHYSYTWPTPAKIRLTLSEVLHLRTAAKKDKKLKETLQKIAPHVEIEVDFP